MTLGQFVKRRRLQLRLEQGDLVRRLPNRDRSWVSRIENDQFKHPLNPDAIAELAAALEVSQADLLEAQGFQVRGGSEGEETPEIDWDDPSMQLWTLTGRDLTPDERVQLARILRRQRGSPDSEE